MPPTVEQSYASIRRLHLPSLNAGRRGVAAVAPEGSVQSRRGRADGEGRLAIVVDEDAKFQGLAGGEFEPADLKTKFTIPTESTADVSLRRLQTLKVAPGEKVRWTFGAASGKVAADANGLVTIPRLRITAEPTVLNVTKGK